MLPLPTSELGSKVGEAAGSRGGHELSFAPRMAFVAQKELADAGEGGTASTDPIAPFRLSLFPTVLPYDLTGHILLPSVYRLGNYGDRCNANEPATKEA